jgi:hypothetical protein
VQAIASVFYGLVEPWELLAGFSAFSCSADNE